MQALSTAADARRKGLSDDEVLTQVYYPVIEKIVGAADIIGIGDMESADHLKRVKINTASGDITGIASSEAEGRIDAIVQGMKLMMPNVSIPKGGFSTKGVSDGSEASAKVSVILTNEFTVQQTAIHTDTDRAIEAALIAAFNSLSAIHKYQKMISENGATAS